MQNLMIWVECLGAFIFLLTGYAAMVYFLNDISWKTVNIKALKADSKEKIGYLIAEVIGLGLLILLFETVYKGNTLCHYLKLIALVSFLFPIAVIDYKKKKIPNIFLLAGLFIRIGFYIAEFVLYPFEALKILKSGILGAAIIGIFFLLILIAFRNSIGMGDIKLFALMSLYQGLWGAMNAIFFSLVVSFFLAIGLLITKRKKRKDSIPFGPSVLAGTMIAIGLSGM